MDLVLFGSDDGSQDLKVIVIICSQVIFTFIVGLSFFCELAIIVTGKIFDSFSVAVVVVFELISEVAVLVD